MVTIWIRKHASAIAKREGRRPVIDVSQPYERSVQTVRAATSAKSGDFPRATPRGRTQRENGGSVSRRTSEEEEVENEETTEVEVEGARGEFRAGIGEERGPRAASLHRQELRACVRS